MTRKERYNKVLTYFQKNMSEATTELNFGSCFQLLCAVMLSAQCTDRRVNMVTPALFQRYPTAKDMAAAEWEDVLEYIKSVSYPNTKARHLVEMSRMIVNDFGGEVPSSLDDLVRLPGVGRKTANVMQVVWFGRAAMPVDTHVFRVSHRLGLSRGKTPFDVEKDLEKNIRPADRPIAHHWLILHGRYTCTARAPHCSECGLAGLCAYHSRHAESKEPAR